MNAISYRNLHFPPAIIQHTVWLYARFNLSLRDVEDLMAERGVEVSYETIRRWVKRFGPQIARRLRPGRPRAHPLPDQPNGSFRSTPLSIITLQLADISYQLPKIDTVVMTLSRCGASLHAPRGFSPRSTIARDRAPNAKLFFAVSRDFKSVNPLEL